MAYLITELTLQETIDMSQKMYDKSIEKVMEIDTGGIKDQTEIQARQKYRDYQFSLLKYLNQLKQSK